MGKRLKEKEGEQGEEEALHTLSDVRFRKR
jgi:hypothetical protein